MIWVSRGFYHTVSSGGGGYVFQGRFVTRKPLGVGDYG